MTLPTLFTMITVLTLLWGGFFVVLVLAFKRERAKQLEREQRRSE